MQLPTLQLELGGQSSSFGESFLSSQDITLCIVFLFVMRDGAGAPLSWPRTMRRIPLNVKLISLSNSSDTASELTYPYEHECEC